MKSLIFALLTLALIATPAGAQVRITDFYSNIDGCDVTINSPTEARNLILSFELQYKGKMTDAPESKATTIDSKSIEIDALEASKYYTYFINWNASKEDGLYIARVELKSKNSEVIDSTHLNFTFGHGALPRLTVADILADSTGLYVLIRPFEPVMADVEVHLIDGNISIYSVKQKNLAFTQAESLKESWKIILENNRQYAARIKLHLYKPAEMTLAYSRYFTAMDNAIITDVFADRTGASATITGKSQVPLQGKVQFEVTKNGEIIEIIDKQSPSIIQDDEKTVESLWKKQLSAGAYNVKVRLLGNDGDLLHQYDKVIEVEQAPVKPTPTPAKQSPLDVSILIYAIAIAFIAHHKRGK